MDKTEKRIEIADILRQGFGNYLDKYGPLPKEQYTIVNALMACRTSQLGGHVNRCAGCGYEEISYNSCRNRHCSKCQGKNALQWVECRVEELLPVPYFHVVLTVPQQLNPIALRNRKPFYDLLFKAGSETLQELAKKKKWIGGEIGFFTVLHTWGQNMMEHPHIHCVVPGGGLVKNRKQWKQTRRNFLFPVKVVGKLFRGKFLDYFQKAVKNEEICFHGKTGNLNQKKYYQDLISELYRKNWIVYTKEPFAGAEQVVKYLSRYTHRIAISNRRIIAMEDGKVTFRWKDYRDRNQWKIMTLDAVEFIRRFLMHFLPKGFVRIRYFGFMANRVRKMLLGICRQLIEKVGQIKINTESIISFFNEFSNKLKCPVCHSGNLIFDRIIPIMLTG